jgi:hypothetical protein
MDVGDWAVRQCCEIRLRAERKAGELLRRMEKAQGKRTDLVGRDDEVDRRMELMGRPRKVSDATTLSDLGITRDQSSQWQKLAAGTQPQFEAPLARRGRS